MRKKIIKEREGTLIIVDIILYISIVIVGYLLLDFENYNVTDSAILLPSVFYGLALLTCIAYFVNRKRDYYEFLMMCVINVLAATYIVVNQNNTFGTFVIGDALLLYAVANIINKVFLAKKYWENKNINFIPKVVNSVLLTFISAFAVYSLYSKEEVAYMIIGYYIIGFGLISLLEPFTYILLENPTIDKLLVSFLKYNKGEEKEVKPIKVKTINRKKISIKQRQGSLVKKEENIKKNVKKKKLSK